MAFHVRQFIAAALLCFVGSTRVAAQISIPSETPLRIKMLNGKYLYGCGKTTVDSIFIRFRDSSAHESFALSACGKETSRIPLTATREVQIRQFDQYVGLAAAEGALIGAVLGGATYWTLGRSSKKCDHCLINTAADWTITGALAGGVLGGGVGLLHPQVSWIPINTSGVGQTKKARLFQRFLGKAKVEGTAGAGFAGIRVAEVLLTDSANGMYTPVKNYRYDWRPAISTGVVTYVYSGRASNLGAGLGFQIVSLPTTHGQALPFPAFTIHIGTPQTEFFGGLVLSPTDSIHLERDTLTGAILRQPIGRDPSNFVHAGTRRAQHLYIGIQIKGSRKGPGDLGIPENAKLEIDTQDTVVLSGDSVHLWAHVEDSLGNVVGSAPATFEVVHGNAKIRNSWLVPTDSSGVVVVRVNGGGKDRYKTFQVKKQ